MRGARHRPIGAYFMRRQVSPFELYGASLYVALNNIFGGSCEIAPANFTEFYVQVRIRS